MGGSEGTPGGEGKGRRTGESERRRRGEGFGFFYTMKARPEPLNRRWTARNYWVVWVEMGRRLNLSRFIFFSISLL
jgi:hypothetical protein